MPITFELKKYLSENYIETGILHGESIKVAINSGFKKLYGIDINPTFVKENKERFEKEINENKLEILEGSSLEILPKVLEKVFSKSTIYLDAHDLDYEGIQKKNYHKSYECPIIQEIDIISKHEIKSHTIIIDDIKMIINNFGWAKGYNIRLEDIEKRIKEINENYKFEFIDKINGCLICYV